MRKLEIASVEEYQLLGAGGAREFVALGFEDPIDECMTWFPLTNVAGPGEFYVEPEEVVAVLRAAESSLDPASARYLWHSHYITVEPSAADVEHFPDWVDAGMVFHAPSGTTTLYNAAGIIRITDTGSAALATPEVTHG